jgi:hypothetical protein
MPRPGDSRRHSSTAAIIGTVTTIEPIEGTVDLIVVSDFI